jgi:hypothetical protein
MESAMRPFSIASLPARHQKLLAVAQLKDSFAAIMPTKSLSLHCCRSIQSLKHESLAESTAKSPHILALFCLAPRHKSQEWLKSAGKPSSCELDDILKPSASAYQASWGAIDIECQLSTPSGQR